MVDTRGVFETIKEAETIDDIMPFIPEEFKKPVIGQVSRQQHLNYRYYKVDTDIRLENNKVRKYRFFIDQNLNVLRRDEAKKADLYFTLKNMIDNFSEYDQFDFSENSVFGTFNAAFGKKGEYITMKIEREKDWIDE